MLAADPCSGTNGKLIFAHGRVQVCPFVSLWFASKFVAGIFPFTDSLCLANLVQDVRPRYPTWRLRPGQSHILAVDKYRFSSQLRQFLEVSAARLFCTWLLRRHLP